MKINETNPLVTSHNKGKTKSSAEGFKDLLEARLNSLSGSPEVTAGASVKAVSSPDPLVRLDGINMTENTINVLDNFAAALNNPALGNEDLAPFISALKENTTAIIDLRRRLEPEDPLAELLDKVAAVTSLETEKYNRGDYAV